MVWRIHSTETELNWCILKCCSLWRELLLSSKSSFAGVGGNTSVFFLSAVRKSEWWIDSRHIPFLWALVMVNLKLSRQKTMDGKVKKNQWHSLENREMRSYTVPASKDWGSGHRKQLGSIEIEHGLNLVQTQKRNPNGFLKCMQSYPFPHYAWK